MITIHFLNGESKKIDSSHLQDLIEGLNSDATHIVLDKGKYIFKASQILYVD